MNIAFYFYYGFNFHIGGTERVGAQLAQGLKERGHNVFLVYVHSEVEQVPGIPTFRLSNVDTKKLDNQENVAQLHDFIIKNQIDVLQVFDYSSILAARLIEKVLKNTSCVTVLHFHNTPLWYKVVETGRWPRFIHPLVRLRRQIYSHKLIRLHYSIFDAIVLLSNTYIDTYSKYKPCHSKAEVTAIINPNTYEITDLLPQKEALRRKKKNIVFVGRLDETQKGFSYLAEIWRRVSFLKPKWNLIIVGSGPSEAYLKSQNLPNCSFEGRQKPLKYYQDASIFIMTSRFEGWPLVLPEAMQNYCVPIAFNSFSALREIVNEGGCGVMVKAFDIDEYVNKLIRLMDDDELRERYAVSGYEYITSNFQTSSILDEWESLYTSLVEQKQNKNPG